MSQVTMDQGKAIAEPEFPPAKMHLIRPKEPAVARVVETRLCTRGGKKASAITRHIALDVSGTAIAGNFLVGQSFGVLPPGADAKGKPHALRLYSIASPSFGEDGAGNVLATTVKRTIAEREPQTADDDPIDHSLFLGVASNYLCNLNVGDEVKITGPQGKRFLLPVNKDAHDYIFLATGTGIAPFRGMLMELLEGPKGPIRSEIHLILGVAYTTDLLYDDELRALAAKHRNFHYHTAISREPSSSAGSAGRRGDYCHDVFARDFARCHAPLFESGRALVYVCGILGMQFGVYREIACTAAAPLYLTVHDPLRSADPRAWAVEDMKRHVHPTRRLMVEVY
jgi:ferredoxin--NADP+ reductase